MRFPTAHRITAAFPAPLTSTPGALRLTLTYQTLVAGATAAVFEQPGEDQTGSRRPADQLPIELTVDTPQLLEAFDILGLTWRPKVSTELP